MKWRGLSQRADQLSQRAEQMSQRAEQWSEELREEAREHVGDVGRWRTAALVVGIAIALFAAVGMYWSREPGPFDIAASVQEALGESAAQPVTGAVTGATLVQIVTTLLNKRGGFINNDISPPGILLDDISHWERGALQQARDMTRALRDDFGRASADADPDDDLARAEPRLHFSENSWMLPASESQYRDARNYLQAYLARLQKREEQTSFVANTVTLDRYLARVIQRLDTSVQRLSACIEAQENPLQGNIPVQARTPAAQLDDIFYEARGSAWALAHLLRAIEMDFSPMLREKNAQIPLQEAIRALDAAQGTIYSPVILNGSGFGLVANHSLVMASYMARADAAVATVRRLLAEPLPAHNIGAEKIDGDNADGE